MFVIRVPEAKASNKVWQIDLVGISLGSFPYSSKILISLETYGFTNEYISNTIREKIKTLIKNKVPNVQTYEINSFSERKTPNCYEINDTYMFSVSLTFASESNKNLIHLDSLESNFVDLFPMYIPEK